MRLGCAVLFVVVVALAVGCSSQTPSPTSSPLQVATPPLSASSPLVRPGAVDAVPTSSAGNGTVQGSIDASAVREPFGGGDLRLAPLVESTTIEKPLFSLSAGEDPLAVLRPDGTFVFSDVPPGHYGLVYWTPAGSFLVPDPETGHSLILDVRAGQVVELGMVRLTP